MEGGVREALTQFLAYPKESGKVPLKVSQKRYSTSKLCNVVTAYALAEKLKASKPKIGVFAFDPGLMPGTGLAREGGAVFGFLWHKILPHLLPLLRTYTPNVDTPEGAGRKLASLALDPKFNGRTAAYFAGDQEIKSSSDSYDKAIWARLWTESERLTTQ